MDQFMQKLKTLNVLGLSMLCSLSLQAIHENSQECAHKLLQALREKDFARQRTVFKDCCMAYDKKEQNTNEEELLIKAKGLFLLQGGTEDEWKNITIAQSSTQEERCIHALYALGKNSQPEELKKLYDSCCKHFDKIEQEKNIKTLNLKTAGHARQLGDEKLHNYFAWQAKTWYQKTWYYLSYAGYPASALALAIIGLKIASSNDEE